MANQIPCKMQWAVSSQVHHDRLKNLVITGNNLYTNKTDKIMKLCRSGKNRKH